MAYASDCHWTCSNFYQLDRFDRKDKHNHQSNEYYSNSDRQREKRKNSNRISLPYENRSKINERIFILIFHSTSFERHKEQMRDLSQSNCRCSDLDNLFVFLLLLLLWFYGERKERMYLSRLDLYWTTPCRVFQSSIDIKPAELNKLSIVFSFSQGSYSIISIIKHLSKKDR